MTGRQLRELLVATGIALALTVSSLASPATATGPSSGRGVGRGPIGHGKAAPAAADCTLVNQQLGVSSTKNTALTSTFASYGDSSGQWVGADSTYSVPLPDGSTAWIFSDTLYGTVTDGTLSPTDSFFLNNTIVQQRGQVLTTRTGGTPTAPLALVPPEANGDWHWFGDGELTSGGRLQIGVLDFHRFGTGAFDWGWKSSQVATIDPTSWTVTSLDPLPSSAGIQWASYYRTVGSEILVYGVEDLGASKYLHVAKVLGGDLSQLQNWRYWTGSQWSSQESASVRLLSGVANEYSVEPFEDGYLLVTQDTTEPFSNKVVGYSSCSPMGPFGGKTELFTMPEVGQFGSYGDPNVFAYNAHEHPELRTGNTLTVSYNVNTFDSNHVYDDVTIYRPRFVDVTITAS